MCHDLHRISSSDCRMETIGEKFSEVHVLLKNIENLWQRTLGRHVWCISNVKKPLQFVSEAADRQL
jgi:hypothetical protein